MHATVSAVTRSRHIRPPENASLLAVLLRNCTCDVRYIFGDLPHWVGCCLNPQKASGARPGGWLIQRRRGPWCRRTPRRAPRLRIGCCISEFLLFSEFDPVLFVAQR